MKIKLIITFFTVIFTSIFSGCSHKLSPTEERLSNLLKGSEVSTHINFPEGIRGYQLVCILTPYQNRIKPNKNQSAIKKVNELLAKNEFYGPEGYSTLIFFNGTEIQKTEIHWNTVHTINSDSIFKNSKSLSNKQFEDCVDAKVAAFGVFVNDKNEKSIGLIDTK